MRTAGTEGLKGAKAADGSTNVCRMGKDEKKGHASVPYGDESYHRRKILCFSDLTEEKKHRGR